MSRVNTNHSLFRPGRKFITLIVIGTFVSLVVGGTLILHKHAFFVPWVNLGSPLEFPNSGEKVDKILYASPNGVRVGTNHGRAYEIRWSWMDRLVPLEKRFKEWREVSYEVETYSQANFGCPYTFWAPPLTRSVGRTVAQAQVRDCRLYMGTLQTNFKILTDGMAWVWTQQKTTGNW